MWCPVSRMQGWSWNKWAPISGGSTFPCVMNHFIVWWAFSPRSTHLIQPDCCSCKSPCDVWWGSSLSIGFTSMRKRASLMHLQLASCFSVPSKTILRAAAGINYLLYKHWFAFMVCTIYCMDTIFFTFYHITSTNLMVLSSGAYIYIQPPWVNTLCPPALPIQNWNYISHSSLQGSSNSVKLIHNSSSIRFRFELWLGRHNTWLYFHLS